METPTCPFCYGPHTLDACPNIDPEQYDAACLQRSGVTAIATLPDGSTFTTPDATFDGSELRIPKWHEFLYECLLRDVDTVLHGDRIRSRLICPSTRTEADGVQESDYIIVDGSAWTIAPVCADCGMVHSSEHACERIYWTYGE